MNLPALRNFLGCLSARCRFWLLPMVVFCLSGTGLAQEEKSALFPPVRHAELRDEVIFTPPEKEEQPAEQPAEEPIAFNWDFDLSRSTTIVISLVLLAALAFLIFRVLGDVDIRRRTQAKGAADGAINLEELEEEHLVAEGVSLSLLQRAENAEQFAVAIRLLYLQLLKDLQDGGLIKYRRDYSNRDYQRQLGNSKLVADFRDVTVDYERYWYGKYPLDRLSYRLVHRKFSQLSQRLTALISPDPYV